MTKNMKQSWLDYKTKRISKDDKSYPGTLLDLKKPPSQIYYRGNLKNNLNKTLGVVGSRRMTSYGRQVLDKILPNLIDQGVVIISGFMYGVDTYAHTLAVEKSASTIAVLGNGLNQCYPLENDKLYTKILEKGGAVISEYEPEVKAKPYMFVQRNRIIAALSTLGVLVIEASEKSGSLVTAKFAQELNRPLFAVPGPIISSVSTGTNYLIKKGLAELVTSSEDILETAISNKDLSTSLEMTKSEEILLNLLKNEQLTIDEISIKLNSNAQEVGSILMMMSIRGLVKEFSGKWGHVGNF